MMNRISLFAGGLACACLLCRDASAQTFVGTNAPGVATNFSFNIPAGSTNLSLVVSNAAVAYSHLLLKQGGTPTDTDYDFISRLDGRTNQINLQTPEFSGTSFGLRVRTPSSSAAQAFRVVLTTNRTDVRSNTYPALKPHVFSTTGTLTPNAWHYFQVNVPTNLPGWRIVLTHTGTGNPDLYIRRDQLPTQFNADKSSVNDSLDTIIYTDAESTNGTFFIGVFLAGTAGGNTDYTLSAEVGYLTQLTWDPGATHPGTQVFTNPSATGGDYYFRITTQNPSVGAWRTALKVTSGEADVYLRRSTFAVGRSNYPRQSTRVGSDGFVLHSSEFAAAENWYVLVRATPGAQWTLMSGDVFVQNLGTLTADGSSGSGSVAIGPEGMRFFRTTTTVGTLAWRLWLNGAANDIFVRKTAVPHPLSTSTYDLRRAAQMLVVPTYLVGGDSYFVGVPGNPDQIINLDSRIQAITDANFSSTNNLNITGYGYVTYRVQVPVQQIAWLTTVTPSAGNANLAVRRDYVPNENNNTAYSEVSGLVSDSVSLVPPSLSDGTFYVTVYGTAPYTCTFTSGNPEITDVAFVSTTINTDTNRVGWRYFRVPDIASQLGSLGWDLILSNQPPGTELAIRQNAVPSRWNYRQSDSAAVYSQAHVDYTGGTSGFLQRPGHQADIWYIGVYNPSNALGAFRLILDRLEAAALAFDSASATRTAVAAGRWEYFRVIVPTNALGWDIRLINVPGLGGQPRLIVRRDQLPDSIYTTPWNYPFWTTSWPSGYQWAANQDWTSRSFNPAGNVNEDLRLLAMGMGGPLEPGTYYVGVNNNSGDPMTYTVQSRGIGAGLALPVTPLTFNGGSSNVINLAAREAAYFSVTVPSNSPSWKVRLDATSGESLLMVLRQIVPNVVANDPFNPGGKAMQKPGNEHFLLLPTQGQTNIPAGTYYLAVISEGQNTTNNNRIGTGTSSFTITSVGSLPVNNLGTLSGPDLTQGGSVQAGESAAYQFTVPAGTLAMEVRLENRVGNPGMALIPGTNVPRPNAYGYGDDGGYTTGLKTDDLLINVANPVPGTYSLIVKGNATSGLWSNATYTVRVHRVDAVSVAFDGGTSVVTNQEAGTWRYFRITVPPAAFGWDVRLINVFTNAEPRMVIRRETAPESLFTTPWNYPQWTDNWPSNYQWAASAEWTDRRYSPDGKFDEYGRILAMGTGRPLEAGNYIVGVINQSGTNAMSYTVFSRGIGTGYTIPITPLAYAGGSVSVTNLPAREAAYFSVAVPTNTGSWKFKLSTNLSEAMIAANFGVLPNVLVYSSVFGYSGVEIQKAGNEHFLLLPPNNQSNLIAGTYYLAVASEGMNTTNNSRIGAGASTFTLSSFGTLPFANLGTVGAVDLVQNGSLEGGEIAGYEFAVPPGTLSMEVRLENRVSNPLMAFRAGLLSPQPHSGSYGQEDGTTSGRFTGDTLVTVANPTSSVWRLMVKASDYGGIYSNASYTLRISAVTAVPLAFDGGSISVTNHPADTWRYYRVQVPTNAFGWDVRLINVPTNGNEPRLVVRRDQLPSALSTTPWNYPQWTANWPSNYQWAATADWTDRNYSPDGRIYEYGRILAMGMGRPLEPGSYYIGVINSANNTNALAYTLLSRGIGTNLSIPITPLAYAGGSVTNPGLAAREAAYYSTVIPSNTPSWKLRLAAGVGETMLVPQKDVLPNVLPYNSVFNVSGLEVQKSGNEHFVLLPAEGQAFIPAGTYYIAAVSEGNNITNSSRIGAGSSSHLLQSQGALPVLNLGTVGVADLVNSRTLEGGEMAAYQFQVPTNVLGIDVRLENRVGNPVFSGRLGTNLPYSGNSYGEDGGYGSGRFTDDEEVTLANPSMGVYSLVVKASSISSDYPNASYTLRIRRSAIVDLNFDASQNGNGLFNTHSNLLADNQRQFYRVVVPATNNNQPVSGWRLNLTQLAGLGYVRARKNLLPSDSFSGMPFTADEAIVVPPFLTPGTWYVEVKGSGSTIYRLTSSQLLLLRPPWDMPPVGQGSTTPGVALPLFGDTGINPAGNPLPGDQGTDLEQGKFHFYAVNVPQFNRGILRVIVEAISGDPDFYLRFGAPPTLSHGPTGNLNPGPLVDRQLTDPTTEYANWVPLEGRYEKALTNGVWHIAIRADGNSNVRYRMRLGVGDIQDLALNGGSFNNQILAADDWRYYRVQMPTNAPRNWNVTFNQVVGNVILYVRDTVPPGQGTRVTDYIDWQTDSKNHGPYPNYDPPATHTIPCPPLRPGHTYYLGFRAVNDATFDVSSSVSGGNIDVTNTIPFYGGFTTNNIAANGVLYYRIDVPGDATRWIHTSIHASSVRLYLDQGSLPTMTTVDHWYSSGANSTLNRYLLTPNNWPWLPSYSYFLTVSNTSATVQPFYFRMDGRNCSTDDNEPDGLPDCWEVFYFGNTGSQNGSTDPDNDGNNNLTEYQDGTNPTDPTSMLARLTVNIVGPGSVNVAPSPAPGPYSYGTIATLTAVPTGVNILWGWTGVGISGDSNPLALSMTTNRTVTAWFGPNYGACGTLRADYQFTSNLLSTVPAPPPLNYFAAGPYFTNQLVDGATRTTVRFPSGTGLILSNATTVIPSNTYTVVLLFKFDTVSGYRRILDLKNGSPDAGLYTLNGLLRFYPGSQSAAVCVTNDTWHQIVVTRDLVGQVAVYSDGVQQLTYNDAANSYGVINAANTIRFFKDNSTEESAGSVARIRLFTCALSAAEVALLDRVPAGPTIVLSDWALDPLGRFYFRVTGPALPLLRVQRSEDLVNWSNLLDVPAFPGAIWVTNPPAPPANHRAFRALAP